MLTADQRKYLRELPLKKARARVTVHPYAPRVAAIARNIILSIHDAIPGADARFLGASALKISGTNDIDIWILCPPGLRPSYVARLQKIWGPPVKKGRKWKWHEGGYDVAVNIVNPHEKMRQEKLRIFEILQHDEIARRTYEALKEAYRGEYYRDYQRAKMEFLNDLLRRDLENQRNLKTLVAMGAAVMEDHVATPHGTHCATSFTKYKLYRHPRHIRFIAKRIAREFGDDAPDAVVGVANGGAVLAPFVAEALGRLLGKDVISLYVEKNSSGPVLRDASNRKLLKGKNVLVVDDTANSGITLRRTVAYLKTLRANMVGAAVVCSRNPLSAPMMRLPKWYAFAVYSERIHSYLPRHCPLCKAKIPLSADFGAGT